MTIQQTGTRVNGNAVITGLTSTAHMRAGYYVFGTGIASGTTIVSVNSATQITLSGNASSGGTATVLVSPWLLNTGTIKLPNMYLHGAYRRSRGVDIGGQPLRVGQPQDQTLKAHAHSFDTYGAGGHSHTVTGTTAAENVAHTHQYLRNNATQNASNGGDFPAVKSSEVTTPTSSESTSHVHTLTGTTNEIGDHTHSGVTADFGSAYETRPYSVVFITCVKT